MCAALVLLVAAAGMPVFWKGTTVDGQQFKLNRDKRGVVWTVGTGRGAPTDNLSRDTAKGSRDVARVSWRDAASGSDRVDV